MLFVEDSLIRFNKAIPSGELAIFSRGELISSLNCQCDFFVNMATCQIGKLQLTINSDLSPIFLDHHGVFFLGGGGGDFNT